MIIFFEAGESQFVGKRYFVSIQAGFKKSANFDNDLRY